MSSPDFTWLMEHGEEIVEKYAGKWIAVYNQEVIGVGDTAVEAAEQAEETVPQADYVLEAVEASADVIYGGL